MAIPSYTGKSLTSQEKGDYLDIFDDLVGVVATSVPRVQNTFLELRWVLSNYVSQNPLIVRHDGSIDYNYLPGSTKKDLQGAADAGLKIYGMPMDWPVYYGWVNGSPILAWGSYAIPYLYGEGYVNPYPGPELVLLDYTPFILPNKETGMCDGDDNKVTVVTFCSTFMMDNGMESMSSNNIAFGPICGWDSVTLGIEETSIPTNAVSVRYYRFFSVLSSVVDSDLILNEDLSAMRPEDYWTAFPEYIPTSLKDIGAFRLLQEVQL